MLYCSVLILLKLKGARIMSEIEREVSKIIQNPDKTRLIRESHNFREELLQAIQRADIGQVQLMKKKVNQYFQKDTIDIIGRIKEDTIRSYKNIMLSHNSMYALVAERGGLDPALAHYMSEKYAIMIEAAYSQKYLEQLHKQFIQEYAAPEHRLDLDTEQSLSEKVDIFISNNFMNAVNIQFIADELFVSKEHLMRTFKEQTGNTINEVLQKKRLEEAASLLATSTFSITDIAIMIGYNSSQYFSKVFKKEYQLTPSQYQRNIKLNDN